MSAAASATTPLYLITGATGKTGGYTARLLLAKGLRVRVFVHRADARSEALASLGADVFTGDLSSFASVRAALEGVTAAYFVFPIAPGLVEATAFFAQAAKEAGVQAVVNMSQVSARREATSHAAFNHWTGERVLDWSGVPVVHLRPTFFSEWLLYLRQQLIQGDVFMPFTTSRHAPIAAEDQGRVIAALLQQPHLCEGQVLELFGPEELTYAEIVARTGKVLGRDIRYHVVPIPDFVKGLSKGRGKEEPVFEQHITEVIQAHFRGEFAGTNDVVQQLTGRTPLTVEEFVQNNREAFEGK